MFLEISKANYISDYKIEVVFNNGEIFIIDLENELTGKVFLPLQDKNKFKNFTIPLILLNGKMGLILLLSIYMT